MLSVLLAIDAESSKIRCAAYEDCTDPSASQLSSIKAMDGISHTIQMPCVNLITGHIPIHEVLSTIDECIDEVLSLLRQNVPGGSSYRITGMRASSFAMNLVGVDMFGQPIGESATLSYACKREDVLKQCEMLAE